MRPRNYEALPYFWGIGEDELPIIITSYITDSGLINPREKNFRIRLNLQAALTQLRHKDKDVWLWVDAIYIDQMMWWRKPIKSPE
ncbi:hypothetical protein WAI453_007922 [Rhynchosporium graminicola]